LRKKRFTVFAAAAMVLLVLVLSACGGAKNGSSPSPGTTGTTANPVKLRIYAQYFDYDTKKP
jgi:hypothetical protein